MASPDTLDFAKLLTPISDDSPTGEDVRADPSPASAYQSIKTERAAARAAERKSIHDGDSSEADEHWRKVLSSAPDILGSQSKDLEIVSWLTEALIRRHGFAGLRDGFRLIHDLVDTWWDDLYPLPDEEGLETRTAPLAGLNGEGAEGVLIAPIRRVPITEDVEPGPYSLWQYQQALEVQRSPDEETREAKAANLGFSLDDIENAVNASSEQFYVDLRDDLTACIDIYKKAGQLLDERCGAQEAPPIRTIIDVLEECLGAVNHIARHKFPAEGDAETAEDDDADTSVSSEPKTSAASGGPIRTREAAFKQLSEIASFFRKTEPHSPLSYLIDKAVKWGNMPLNELMMELIPDSSSREHYSELTGVKTED